jgi:uncharacterized protein YdiU (UPF0061 family)
VAPSFIRFGNFELPASRGDGALLERLVDFTIARDFPELGGTPHERRARWITEVAERTARMVVHWMRVGFVHGVMNTDNMSILGLTIDYGPYGWLDDFDPTWTPNTTDAGGRRYRYEQQPAIAQWNLMRLAEAVAPLFDSVEPLQAALDSYGTVFNTEYRAMTAAKLGFAEASDAALAMGQEVLALLQAAEVDYTLFFRALGEIETLPTDDAAAVALLGDVFYDDAKRAAHAAALAAWLRRWHAAVTAPGEPFAARRARMHVVYPRYTLRNYLAQQAIDRAEAGDASLVHTLLDVMRRPYDDQPEHAAFAARRPEWARNRAGCSMLSCSS